MVNGSSRLGVRLGGAVGLCSAVTLALWASYYAADHDRRVGGQTPDQGWEEPVALVAGGIVAVAPTVALTLLLNRRPTGGQLGGSAVAGLFAVVVWWLWTTSFLR